MRWLGAGGPSWAGRSLAVAGRMEEKFGLASFHEFGFAVVRVLPVPQAEALAAVADAMVRQPHSPRHPTRLLQ